MRRFAMRLALKVPHSRSSPPLHWRPHSLRRINAQGMRGRALYGLCGLTLVLSLLLGGGTRSGFLSDTILELAALPLFLAALSRMMQTQIPRETARALWLAAAIALLPLFQLVPMPPQIWTLLPNRGVVAESFRLLDSELPWMPLSVTPRETWLAALSSIPPLAIFLGTLVLEDRRRHSLCLLILVVGAASVLIGLIQVGQGPDSPFRFYAFTNTSDAVGFFANRNHFAALLYALILLTSAFAVDAAIGAGGIYRARKLDPRQAAKLLAATALLVTFSAAQIITRSRAGLALSLAALFAAPALALSARVRGAGGRAGRLLTAAIFLAAVFVFQYGLYRVQERFAADPMADARITFARNTLKAVEAFMPFGSGMGSFVNVYGLFEQPEDLIGGIYANRAHNDILEFALEAGLPGIAVFFLFVAWLVRKTGTVWSNASDDKSTLNLSLQRSGTLLIGLVLIHSLVDYPLRTGSIMAVFAFACALLIESPDAAQRREKKLATARSARLDRAAKAAAVFQPAKLPEIDWPVEWRKPPS